jgi:hypothetical protein
LDTQQNLLDSDRGLPSFIFVQDRQADGARWIDVWVEQRRDEFACKARIVSYASIERDCAGACVRILTLWRFRRVLWWKIQSQHDPGAILQQMFVRDIYLQGMPS